MELCEEFRQAETQYFPDSRPCQDPAAPHAVSRSSSDDEESSDADEASSPRRDDHREERVVNDFLATGCGCSLGPKKSPCSKLFSRSALTDTRMNCLELSKK